MRTGLAYLVDAYRQEHHFFVETPSKLGLETHTQVAHLLLQRKLRFSGKCFSVDTWARYRPLKQVFSIPQSVSKRCASTVNADEDEFVELVTMNREQVQQALATNQIQDGKTLVALYHWLAQV